MATYSTTIKSSCFICLFLSHHPVKLSVMSLLGKPRPLKSKINIKIVVIITILYHRFSCRLTLHFLPVLTTNFPIRVPVPRQKQHAGFVPLYQPPTTYSVQPTSTHPFHLIPLILHPRNRALSSCAEYKEEWRARERYPPPARTHIRRSLSMAYLFARPTEQNLKADLPPFCPPR